MKNSPNDARSLVPGRIIAFVMAAPLMRSSALLLCACSMAPAIASDGVKLRRGDGLLISAPTPGLSWRPTPGTAWSTGAGPLPMDAVKSPRAYVSVDYYVSSLVRDRSASGLRASGGVGFARRGASWLGRMPLGGTLASDAMASMAGSASDSSASVYPYLGLGYTGIYAKSGWGFSADVGLMGTATRSASGSGLRVSDDVAGVRIGDDNRSFSRSMRPVLQLGVSRSF